MIQDLASTIVIAHGVFNYKYTSRKANTNVDFMKLTTHK